MKIRGLDELVAEVLNGKLSRRDVLRRGAALGLGAPMIMALLAACGDDDDDDGGDETEATATEADGGGAATEPEEEATEEATEEGTEEATEAGTEAATEEDGATEEATEEGTEEATEEGTEEAEGTETGETGAITREFEGTTIRWSTSLAESERQVFDDTILPMFEEMSGISVEFLQIEAADFIRQLEAQVQADAVEIDLFAIDNNSLAPLVANELIDDLSEFENEIPAETIENLLPVLHFDDTLYFLPYRPNVQITYYNSGAFEEAGLETPTTWDDLMSVAQSFFESEGIGKVAVQGSPEGGAGPVGVTVTEFIWQAGGDPLVINSPEAAEAFTFLQGLNEYLNPQTPTAKFDTMNTYLANDSVYLGQNWPFGVNVIVEEFGRDDILSYSGWAGPAGEFHVLGGEVQGIPKGAPNRDAALMFARFLMLAEVQETLTRELAWPAVRTDAYGAVEDWQQPYFESVQASMENTMARPNVVYWGQVQQIMADAWSEIVAGGADVQSTLDGYQEQIEQEQQAAEG